jgi:hypothetical protein
MKTIAQQLNIKEFPFFIKDKNGKYIYQENLDGFWSKAIYNSNGNEIYYENSENKWIKREFNSEGRMIYYEDSNGCIDDKRPKHCENKVVEIDGIKYKLVKA